MPKWQGTAIGDCKHGHGNKFADREERDERKRIHAGEIGLAVGNVHGSPQNAGAQGGEYAERRFARCGLMR